MWTDILEYARLIAVTSYGFTAGIIMARNGDLVMARFVVADERGALVSYQSTKTWIAGSDAARVTHPSGLTYELTPLTNPASGSLTVRATFRGQPLSGALVRVESTTPEGGQPFDPSVQDSVPDGGARPRDTLARSHGRVAAKLGSHGSERGSR